jgi:uncharacterized MAPEG superfamily protein
MKKNMGGWDRSFRLIAAAVFAVLLITGIVKGTLAIVLAILAAVFVITTFVAFCPLYVPLGLSTRKGKKSEGSTRIDA